MDERNGFAQWLRARRKEYGYTQEELAKLAGCSAIALRRIESGNLRPSRQLAELLVASLEVAPGEQAVLVRQARAGPHESSKVAGHPPESSSLQDHNLPSPATSLIGRKKELATTRALLKTPEVRLLTLTGPPGVGKTRLAIALAQQLAGVYRDGVWLADLSPLRDPELVTPTISRVLGLRESADVSARPPGEALQLDLQEKELLLVLDNFEQVVVAATEIGPLLAYCPRVKVLATSRIPLRIYGEHEYPVAPLSTPDRGALGNPRRPPSPQMLRAYEAVRLFVERAQAIRPDFQLSADNAQAVGEICVRLDGLPLPIELAAARIRQFTPGALLDRLEHSLQFLTDGARDYPARQRTLRSAIEWSYSLLSESEQQLFRRMAVFNGGRTMEALAAVCANPEFAGEDVPQMDIVEGVKALLEQSLVKEQEGRNGEPRFWMLDTIQEYALEKLQESGESEALRKRHALYFLSLCEEAETHLSGPGQQEWLDRLEDEHDNLQVALRWAGERNEAEDVEAGLRGAAALHSFWALRGYYTEGRQHLNTLLAKAPGSPQPSTSRIKAMLVGSLLARSQGDYSAAKPAAEDALRLARETEDRASIADALRNLGAIELDRWNPRAARTLMEECLAIRREIGDRQGIADSLQDLGTVAFQQGDCRTSRALIEESLATWRALGNKGKVASLLRTNGVLALEQGDLDYARSLFSEGLAISKELGFKDSICSLMSLMGSLTLEEGDYAGARALLEQSLAMSRESGVVLDVAEALQFMGDLERMQVNHSAAACLYDEVAALSKEIDDMEYWFNFSALAAIERGDHASALRLLQEVIAIDVERGNNKGLYEDLATLGVALVGAGQTRRGTVVLAAADGVMSRLGGSMCQSVRMRLGSARTSAMAQLGAAEFEKAWREGYAMSLEEAVEYALGPRPRSVEEAVEYALEGKQ